MPDQCAIKGCVSSCELNSKLCEKHNQERMLEASCARIFSRTGLTWSNAKEFSEDNWIEQKNGSN